MRVEWTPRAINHLGRIQAHISDFSVSAAKRTVRAALASTRRLTTHPRSGRKVPERNLDELREVISEHRYRVIYRIRADHLEVLGVFDTHQDPVKLEESLPLDL